MHIFAFPCPAFAPSDFVSDASAHSEPSATTTHFSPPAAEEAEAEAEAFRRRARAQRPLRPDVVFGADTDPERRSTANANVLLRPRTVKLVVLALTSALTSVPWSRSWLGPGGHTASLLLLLSEEPPPRESENCRRCFLSIGAIFVFVFVCGVVTVEAVVAPAVAVASGEGGSVDGPDPGEEADASAWRSSIDVDEQHAAAGVNVVRTGKSSSIEWWCGAVHNSVDNIVELVLPPYIPSLLSSSYSVLSERMCPGGAA